MDQSVFRLTNSEAELLGDLLPGVELLSFSPLKGREKMMVAQFQQLVMFWEKKHRLHLHIP